VDSDRGSPIEFRNDTAINVVGLLKAPFGDSRLYPLALDRFPLGDDLVAVGVTGEVKLTRLREAIMTRVEANGRVALDCVRCLRSYDQPFAAVFSEEFRQSVDVRTGVGLELADDGDEEPSLIDENHELDLGEVLRQEILIALPMRPDCGELCPGPDLPDGGDSLAEPGDDRFAELARLLGDDGRPASND